MSRIKKYLLKKYFLKTKAKAENPSIEKKAKKIIKKLRRK